METKADTRKRLLEVGAPCGTFLMELSQSEGSSGIL
jgi:hypothetical protein